MGSKTETLLIITAILMVASTQGHTVNATERPAWVSIDVLSFDATGITAKITLTVVGNHQDNMVWIHGEDYSGEVAVSVARIVRQVVYSVDTNLTIFQYSQRFSSPLNYNVTPTVDGLPAFPFDQANFRFGIETNFDANIDTHSTMPSLPNGNYQGVLTYTGMSEAKDYTYTFLLTLTHSESFVESMIILTWGVIIILLFATGGLILALFRRYAPFGNIVTATSSLVVFIPVYELALQTYKSPLGMTLPDIFVFGLLVADVAILVCAVQRRGEVFGLKKAEEYPTLVKYFGLPWLQAKSSNHVLWMRWNQGDRLKFVERWERTLALLDSKGLVKPKIVRMMKNPDQFLDTMAQIEVASVLLTKGFLVELEASKSGRTPDIFLINEGVCTEVKNLHTDAVLLEQAISGEARVVWLRDRLPSAVEEKYDQLPDSFPNILVVIAPPEVQFDEFEDFFIDIPTTVNITTGEEIRGALRGFFYQERIDGTNVHMKLGAVIMWKDQVRTYLVNPNANFIVSEDLLRKMTS